MFVLNASIFRLSDDFKPSLLNERKKAGFYVDPKSNPLEINKEEAEKYFHYITILAEISQQGILTITDLLENPALYDNFQKHFSRESGERVMKELKKAKEK